MSQASYGALVNAVKNLEREVYRGRYNCSLPVENSIRIDMLVCELTNFIKSQGGQAVKNINTIMGGPNGEIEISKIVADGGFPDPLDPNSTETELQKNYIINIIKELMKFIGLPNKVDQGKEIIVRDSTDTDPEHNYSDLMKTLQTIYDILMSIVISVKVVVDNEYNTKSFSTYLINLNDLKDEFTYLKNAYKILY